MKSVVELYSGTRDTVVDCWAARHSAYVLNLLQIVMVTFFALLALPAVPFHKNRFDFGACVFLGAFIWVVSIKLVSVLI